MKNSLLSASALLLTATVLGQTSSSTLVLPQVSPQMKTVTAEDDRIRHVGGEWLNHIGPVNQLGPAAPINNGPSGAAAINETVIGTTTYDLQTNTAIQRRLLNHTNGDLFAVWTMSQNNDNVWATRGTGYNHFDGTAWDPNPTAQIEANNRTGWPNLVITGTNKEFLAAHSTQNDEIATADRPVPGTGTWNIGATSQLDIQVWNRMALGGPNNNTVHLIGLTLPSTIQGGNPGVPFNGVDGALLYNRSSDGGVTWNQISVQLPGADSAARALVTGGTPTFGGDSYSIDANGNNVVISESSIGTGARLWKSTDNGTTWTKTEIWGTPAFDEVNDMIPATFADAVVYPDGANHVIVDGNGTGHVFFGRMGIANDVLNDGTFSFFPGFNGLMYWNEDFGKAQPVTITGAIDHDGDGTLNSIVGIPNYGSKSLSSYPSAGMDANGDIYLVYAALREDKDNSIQNYRHVFGMKSSDSGCSWTEPVDLTDTPVNDFSEIMYPSLARRVDNKLHILTMKDFEPGIAVNGDMDATTSNDIVYMDADVTDLSSTIGSCVSGIDGDTLFCAGGGNSNTLRAICGTSWSWSTGETTQSITVNTTGMFTVSTTTPCGQLVDTLEVVAPGAGPAVTITPSATELCPGGTGTITASVNVAGTNFLWSTGATTAATNITGPGVYTVTATNCGGTTVSSITITQPSGPPAAVINGPISICTGQTITLTAQMVTGGSYLWSTGDVTTTTTISAPGTYTVTVTNCGGTSTASTTVTTEALPTAQVMAQGGVLTACEGENVTLTASGGASYVWSNGDTSATIVLNDPADSGPYTVTVSNNCGDTDVSTSVTVTINANPAAPVVTVNGGTFTSSATGTHTWFINGVAQSETGPSFTPTNLQQGDIVTVQVTDGNGCTSPESDPITSVEPVDVLRASLNVFPNPNDGQFAVYFNNADADSYTLNVRNVVGQVVYTTTQGIAGNHIEVIDLSNLSKGMYFLTVANSTAETSMKIITR